MMKYTNDDKTTSDKSIVVNFRATEELVQNLDQLARAEHRSRAGVIALVLARAANLDEAGYVIELIIKSLNSEIDAKGETEYSEFIRGQLHGAKTMLASLLGDRAKNLVLEKVRKTTNLPIPHIVPRMPDGKRYGYDSDAG
jgi:hypothetical protein